MKITPKIVEDHGIKPDEYEKIISLIGKEPNLLELGIFSAMWNEHCSYKSSKKHLKNLPTKNKNVIQGPGENAGIIDIDDNDALVFKIESHNHPSYIEPYQGAATGVGGILRDVFTMGARPIATLNSIHFGSHNHPKTKNLLNGVVSGIGGYGNCIGIPTVGGEVHFDETYNENILVNAIAPGPYPSAMLGSAVNHDYSEIAKRNPRNRVGTPEDMAGLAIFLCSRAGAYTVGETITSDGGIVKTSTHNLS